MPELTVFDTDILIDAGREIPDALACIAEVERERKPSISIVTQMELMVGCRNKKELRATEKFVTRFEILNLSESIADHAVGLIRTYRLSHGLLIADALIAATAIENDAALITKNQRDYNYIEGLSCLPYPVTRGR